MASRDLVIALDYYDGEVEGFARTAGACSYFVRLAVGENDINEYVCVATDCVFLEQLMDLLRPSPAGLVHVYAGDDDRVNHLLDEVMPAARARLAKHGRTVHGRSFLESR